VEASSPPRRAAAPTLETATGIGMGPWLLVALLVAGGYAAFSGGAIAIPAESRLQVVIAATGLVCCIGLAAGHLRAGRVPLAWGGVGLLTAFALWSALSVTWSVVPDLSWLAANRALAYAAVAAIALVAARSSRDAPSLVAIGFATVSVLVVLYGLGGKIIPEIHIGAFSLDPGGQFPRLREPIGYWNAEGLLCVMTTPFCIWLAAARTPAVPVRIGALVLLSTLLLTAALTYSRGAILAFVAVLAVMVAAGPDRGRRLLVAVLALLAALPSIIVAFGRYELSKGDLSLSTRAHGGAILGVVLIASMVALVFLARELIRLDRRSRWTERHTRVALRAGAVAGGIALIGIIGALALSSRGLTGEISHQVTAFEQPKRSQTNTPARLISTNGSNRWIWWQEALGAFNDKPIAGWGAGSFPVVSNLYSRYPAPVLSTHSLPLQLLSDTGLIGAALGLGGLGLLGAAGVSAVRRSSGAERSARVALLAAAAAWGVHSMVDWDWEIPAVALPALVAAAAAAAPVRSRAEPPRRLRAPAAFAAFAALGALILAISATLPALAEHERLQGLSQAASGGSLRQGEADALLAAKLDPLAAAPLVAAAELDLARGNRGRAASLIREAADREPDTLDTLRRLVSVQFLRGDFAAAAAATRRASDADPLAYDSTARSTLFGLEAPPPSSPTAFGTPPP
jgi:O-Antigen ligase